MIRRMRPALLVLLAALVATPSAAGQNRNPTPLYAYYYIWFNPSSWNRAKTDYPLLGRYSSDETSVMRTHVAMARRAGIDGFIVSWKSTPTLDGRLAKLIRVAEEKRFKLTIIYQGLDFERRPLPVQKVAADLDLFATRFAGSPVFAGFGKPVVIWSGTWEFSMPEIERVRAATRQRLLLLATEKAPDDYRARASAFDGDAYYWSSANPDTYPDHAGKLRAMADAVHDSGGLWFAPAAPGFDARSIGGETVVGRAGGEMLRRQLDAAQEASPDAIGLISWNEFSENSHVEPSEKYGTRALEVLADVRGTHFEAPGELDSSTPATTTSSGPGAVAVILGFLIMLGVSTVLLRRHPREVPRP